MPTSCLTTGDFNNTLYNIQYSSFNTVMMKSCYNKMYRHCNMHFVVSLSLHVNLTICLNDYVILALMFVTVILTVQRGVVTLI